MTGDWSDISPPTGRRATSRTKREQPNGYGPLPLQKKPEGGFFLATLKGVQKVSTPLKLGAQKVLPISRGGAHP